MNRISQRHSPWEALALVASTLVAACPKQELAPLDPCTVSSVSTRVDQTGISKVDLLFMVDNSGSMANKQVKLAEQLPRLVNVLTSGDRYWGQTPPDGITDKERYFTAVTSLHLAVTNSSMGGLASKTDLPPGAGVALQDCVGLGSDGEFLRSTKIAVEGVTAGSNTEFPDRKKGDVVLAPEPACADIATPPRYQDYEVGKPPSADDLVASFGCVARVGVRGCPFEQQLESAWKALAPSDGKDPKLDVFLNDTKGHGDPDGDNAGFVRDDAILAIMEVTDEEDCSLTQDGTALNSYGVDATARFGAASGLNMRCYSDDPLAQGLVWPVSRYIDGLKSLKPDNQDLVIFAAIVGIPEDAVGQDLDAVLARPEMQYQPSITHAGLPEPSCTNSKVTPPEDAYPPRRLVQVAKGFGEDAVVYSICADDYAPALDRLIDKIASKLKGSCLPRQLTPNASGLVECEVSELLPTDQTKCVAARGHLGDPLPRVVREGTHNTSRLACRMQQVPVSGGVPEADLKGWYYDDFSSDLKDACSPGEQQRIVFSFGDLPSGAGAVIDCLQPVARVDPSAKGFDAIGTRCDGDDALCKSRSDDHDQLICVNNTCQASCSANPQCAPGWVCATDDGKAGGPKFCQLATCPAVEPNGAVAVDGGT